METLPEKPKYNMVPCTTDAISTKDMGHIEKGREGVGCPEKASETTSKALPKAQL